MSIEDALRTLLLADAPLMTLATGGVYSYDDLGQRGFVPKNPVCATAFVTVNTLITVRPSIIIRDRSETTNNQRFDTISRETSTQGVVEFWMYVSGRHATLETLSVAVWKVLHGKIFPTVGQLFNQQQLKGIYAPEFDNVSLRREDYSYKRLKRIT